MTVERHVPGYHICPITTNAVNPVNQSEFEEIIHHVRQGRENARVASFTPDWSMKQHFALIGCCMLDVFF